MTEHKRSEMPPRDTASNPHSKFQFSVIFCPLPAHCFCNKTFAVIVSSFLAARFILRWKMPDVWIKQKRIFADANVQVFWPYGGGKTVRLIVITGLIVVKFEMGISSRCNQPITHQVSQFWCL